jgi:hypothetical protein
MCNITDVKIYTLITGTRGYAVIRRLIVKLKSRCPQHQVIFHKF